MSDSGWFKLAMPSFFVGGLVAMFIALAVPKLGIGFAKGLLSRRGTYSGPCHFVQLSHGRVRYRLFEPVDPSKRNDHVSLPQWTPEAMKLPLLVCCHGLGFPSEMLSEAAERIANQAGSRVLIFDLYGRGWSDAPDLPNNPELFVGQIAELMFALNESGSFSLMGVSMGGAIVTHFAMTYPEKVRSLVLVAAAGLPMPPEATAGRDLLTSPIIGPVIGSIMLPNLTKQGASHHWESTADSGPAPHVYRHWQTFVRDHVDQHPGLVRSLYSSICHFPLDTVEPEFYHKFAKLHTTLPILMVWGSKDELIPVKNGMQMQQLLNGEPVSDASNARVTLVEIEGGNHNCITERPAEVAEIVGPWFRHTITQGASSSITS